MSQRRRYIVEVELKEEPHFPMQEYLRNYIREAVDSWGGQFHPDNPLFSANIRKVIVKHYKEK